MAAKTKRRLARNQDAAGRASLKQNDPFPNTESRRKQANGALRLALERACKILASGSEQHDTRRHIASRILERAESGDCTLGGLTEAGRIAANELRPAIAV